MPQDLKRWRPPALPGGAPLQGRHVRLEPLAPQHAAALHAANRVDDAIWTWLPYGPFVSLEEYARWLRLAAAGPDPRFYAIRAQDAKGPGGVASLMRATPEHGVIEVGHICLSPGLQRTTAASEAIFLLATWAFDAGYRRLEWKCAAENAPSRRAAARFGFAYEGVFRSHMIVKGANRDTAWFAMTERDWPDLRKAWDAWLDPASHDAAGRQRVALGDLTEPVRRRAEAEHRRR